MVNRNAARHLLLVVSILLCFFVYMGYRLRGSGEAAVVDDAPSGGIAALSPDTARLMTMNDSPDASPAPGLRPPVAAPSSRPPAMAAGENIPNIPEAARSAVDQAPSAAPMVRPPSGSIEETAARPSAASGAITGLVPALPAAAAVDTEPEAAENRITPPAGLLTTPGDDAARPNALPLPPLASESGDTVAVPAERAAPLTSIPPAPPAASAASMPPPVAPAARTEAPRQSAPPPAARPDREPSPEVSETIRMYVVRPGDTLSRIAANELGSISLADNIFLLNRDVIADPNHLMAGVRIRLPIREPSGVEAPGQTALARPEQVRVHTVAAGETLSSIALRYYGSSSGWRFLYEVNTKSVPNPNRLAVGTELIVPPYGEAP